MSALTINVNDPTYDKKIRIGRLAENDVTEIRFDLSAFISEYGEGTATLAVRRNGDSSPYPVSLTITDGVASWAITDTETAVSGQGYFDLTYVVGEKVKKSPIYTFICRPSLTGSGDVPDGYENWLETLTEMTAEVESNATAAANSASAAAESATEASASATAAASSASASAESATSASASASAAATSAQAAQSALEGMTFVAFAVQSDGHVYISNSDLLGTTTFELTHEGHLEVTY